MCVVRVPADIRHGGKKGVSEWRTLAVDCSMEKFTKNRASDAKYARAVPLDGEKVYKV